MGMKLINSWRFAIKCMRLSYNLKINLLCMGFLFILAILQEIFYISGGSGAFMLLIIAMYPAQLVSSVCGSQMVLSSPYRKPLMTSLPTVLNLCSGMAVYLAIIGIELIRVHMIPQLANFSSFIILSCGIILLLLDIYVGLAYKCFALSLVILSVSMIGFYYMSGIGRGTALSQNPFCLPLPIAIAAGLCLALVGSALQYGISRLVYKKPMSRFAIFGLLRQQA